MTFVDQFGLLLISVTTISCCSYSLEFNVHLQVVMMAETLVCKKKVFSPLFCNKKEPSKVENIRWATKNAGLPIYLILQHNTAKAWCDVRFAAVLNWYVFVELESEF